MHVHSNDLLTLRDIGLHPERRSQLQEQLWGSFANQDLNAHLIADLLAYVFDEAPPMPALTVAWDDVQCLNNLRQLKAQTRWVDGRLRVHGARRLHYADASYDNLADCPTDWSLVRTLNHLWLTSIEPTKKVAVITSVRDEGVNILEWIAHYRVQGVDSIFVYTNDNHDGSDELLLILHNAGVINLVPNLTNLKTINPIQGKVFNHASCFLNELWDHEWVFYLDPDEFFVSAKYPVNALAAIVDRYESEGTLRSGICFNWKWFGSQRQLRREPGILLDRYLTSTPNSYFKTLARLRDTTGFLTTHLPRLISGGRTVDAALNAVDAISHHIGPTFDLGQLNHYWNKSFEEFVAKRQRGREDLNYVDFFRLGNSGGQDDKPPPELVARVKQEIAALLALPGVSEQVANVEQQFRRSMQAFDSRHNIAALYEQNLQAS